MVWQRVVADTTRTVLISFWDEGGVVHMARYPVIAWRVFEEYSQPVVCEEDPVNEEPYCLELHDENGPTTWCFPGHTLCLTLEDACRYAGERIEFLDRLRARRAEKEKQDQCAGR